MEETRVEKFRKYREEIQNSFTEEDMTTKKKTSDRVSKLLSEEDHENESNTISFDELMGAYEIYNKGGEAAYVSPLIKTCKKRKAINIAGLIVVGILAIALIVVGIFTFGGNK